MGDAAVKWSVKGVQVLRQFNGLMVVVPAPADEELNKIDPEQEYTIDVKKRKIRRSLSANAFSWVLCQKIAETLSKGQIYASKEDVYRKAVRDCGHFTVIPTRTDAIERFTEIWVNKGIGWLIEDMGECRNIKNYHNLFAYHGSSVYTVEEMSRLIECLLDECSQLGIPVEPDEYIRSLLEEWGNDEQSQKSGQRSVQNHAANGN